MLTTNKKNNIAKSIALVLALVLAFSCILTACADKTARQDVEDLKATVDALNKDVETVEGVANSAVTSTALEKALADALAAYLNKEGHDADIAALLANYEKTEDAHKFVTELLKGYYTQAQIDEMLKGYYTKAEVETLVECFVKKDEVPGFIADYLKTPEAKDAIAALLDDVYVSLGDWDAATAAILTALANLTDAMAVAEESVFTVADYAAYEEIMEKALGADLDAQDLAQLVVDIVRATSAEDLAYLTKLAEDAKNVPNASDAIKAINDKIAALKTASAGKIDTDDKAALAEIKQMIVDFDAKYGFNKTPVTMDTATIDFANTFCGVVADQDAIDAKLVTNGYASNADYVDANMGGLKIDDYVTMQNKYDELAAWAKAIDAMIVGLVANIGETDIPTASQVDLIEDVMAEIVDEKDDAGNVTKPGFVSSNNGITTPIEGWETYKYYEWLRGKKVYNDDKNDAKAELDVYASDIADKFESAQMNEDNAKVVLAAKAEIDKLIYAEKKSYAEATADLEAIVKAAKADMFENFAKYSFADTALKAVATIEAKKAALTDAYDSVVKLADSIIVDLKAVTTVDTDTYPWTEALKKLDKTLKDGITAIDLAKAKIDAKEEIKAYAVAYLANGANALFDGNENKYNDIEAIVLADAEATFASIDAVAKMDDMAKAIAAAKVEVDESAYYQALDVYKATKQAELFFIAEDVKNYASVDAQAVATLAHNTVVKVRAEGAKAFVLTETVTTWKDAYDAAKVAVDAVITEFEADEDVADYIAAVTP